MFAYEDVLRDFQKNQVKYILVGGLAVNLLGSWRNTADLDILAEMSRENMLKVVKVLKKKRYRIKQPIDPAEMADPSARKKWIKTKHLKALNFYNEKELKEVDIIIDSPVSYGDAKKDAVKFRRDGLTLPVISIENLIRMKRASARPIDAIDIEELKIIKDIGRKR